MNEYLNAEYNTSKNTRESYATDLYLLAKYYANKNIIHLKKKIFKNTYDAKINLTKLKLDI